MFGNLVRTLLFILSVVCISISCMSDAPYLYFQAIATMYSQGRYFCIKLLMINLLCGMDYDQGQTLLKNRDILS